jgi:hypothetical protein
MKAKAWILTCFGHIPKLPAAPNIKPRSSEIHKNSSLPSLIRYGGGAGILWVPELCLQLSLNM